MESIKSILDNANANGITNIAPPTLTEDQAAAAKRFLQSEGEEGFLGIVALLYATFKKLNKAHKELAELDALAKDFPL